LALLGEQHKRVSALTAEGNIVSAYVDLYFTSSEARLLMHRRQLLSLVVPRTV
jgi:hypothetical protein